ncbi:MAG: hypothetical protein [Circular genetic element sp.]|nr:MAG: hypothetical protein [Circular genetic element sp.]
MAIWAGSSYATNVAAQAFNHVIPGVTAIVRKKNGLLYHILGKKEKGSLPFGGPKFSGMEVISGVKHEVTLLGVIPTISTVAAGSAEYAAATMNYAANTFGAAEFALAHFADNHAIPESEWDKIKSPDTKQMENFVKQKSEAVMLGWEQTLGTALSANTAATGIPDATHVGSWCYAVTDAQTTSVDESTFGTYGTIDRTDSGNADFRGYRATATGHKA